MGWFGDRIMSQTPRASGCPVVLFLFIAKVVIFACLIGTALSV